MAHFVISDEAFASAIGEGLSLHPRNHPIHGVINFAKSDGIFAATGGEDGGFIQEVGEVSPCETGCAPGDGFQGDIRRQFLVAAMHIEDGQSSLDIWRINAHLAVETTRTHEGRVQHVWAVGGGDDDNSAVSLESIHLREELVEGLFPFIVPTTDTSSPLATYGINFIDKDQTRAIFLSTFE